MKALRVLSAVMAVFMLVLGLIGFMVYHAVESTLLSADYIRKSMVNSGLKSMIAGYILYKAESSLPEGHLRVAGIDVDGVVTKLAESVDRQWIEDTADKTANGIYSYVVSDTDRLPVLDIRPLKTSLVNGITDELLKMRELQAAFYTVKTAAVMLNGPYKSFIKNGVVSDAFLDSIMSKPEIKALGLETEFVKDVIAKYSNVKDVKTDTSAIEREIIHGLVADFLRFDTINDEFDLNVFMEKAYGDGINPLAAVKNRVAALKRISMQIFIVAAICLLILPLLAAARPVKLYRTMAAASAICGIAALAAGFYGKSAAFIHGLVSEAVNATNLTRQIDEANVSILENWLAGLLKGYFGILTIQGAIVLAVAVVVFLVLCWVDWRLRFGSNKAGESVKEFRRPKYGVVSLLGSYALIAVIVVNTYLSVATIARNAEGFGTSSAAAGQVAGQPDFASALAETLNAEFIKDLVENLKE